MFSGLVQAKGTIAEIKPLQGGLEYRVRVENGSGRGLGLEKEPLVIGESICTQGVCLTVTKIHDDGYSAQIMPETLRVTSLGQRKVGDQLNLERALQMSDRIGGHLVSGHVDCLGTVSQIRRHEKWAEIRIDFPVSLQAEVARKGSICLDGVSLTVTEVGDNGDEQTAWLEVALIPLTQSETTLGKLQVGEKINLETDLVAKYVAQAAKTFSGNFAGNFVDRSPGEALP